MRSERRRAAAKRALTPAARRVALLAGALLTLESTLYSAVAPLLPHYARTLHLSKSAAGVLAATYAAGLIPGSLLGGWLARRLGVRTATLVGLAGFVAATAPFGFVHPVVALDSLRAIQGVAAGCIWGGALTWLIQAAPRARRGELIGAAFGAAIFGTLFGPVVGTAAVALGTRVTFAAVAVAGVGLALAVLRTPVAATVEEAASAHAASPDAASAHTVPPDAASAHTAMPPAGRALRHPLLIAVATLVVLQAAIVGTSDTLIPLRMAHLGATGLAVGATFFVWSLLSMGAAPLIGRLADRQGALRAIRIGLPCTALVLLLLPLPHSALALALLAAIGLSAGLSLLGVPVMSLIAAAAEQAGIEYASGVAIFNLAWAIGETIGAPGGARIAQASSDFVPFAILAAVTVTMLGLRGLRVPRRARYAYPAVAQQLLHLSSVIRTPLLDRAGDRLGRTEDVIVRLADGGYPPVTGLQANIGGRELFVPVDRIASLAPGSVRLAGEKLNLGRFERRPGEVLLRQDVLGRKLIDVKAGTLITAHELELICVDGWWRVAGVNPSPRAWLRRLLPGKPAVGGPQAFIDWSDLEPFVGHVPSARLRLTHRRLARLHPAQIADLVEAASHEEGEEIIKAVGQDRELEADVFEELDDEHQREFIRERSDADVARVLAKMATDDAADLIGDLDQERREPVLNMLPWPQRRKIRLLLGYNPSTAGGLMSPEFISLSEQTTAERALSELRASSIAPETLTTIYVRDAQGKLSGMVPLAALVRASPPTPLRAVAAREPVSVRPSADLPEVARLMSDYNLTMLPIVDDDGHQVGVVTVDDVLELTIPGEWRRRYGLVGG